MDSIKSRGFSWTNIFKGSCYLFFSTRTRTFRCSFTLFLCALSALNVITIWVGTKCGLIGGFPPSSFIGSVDSFRHYVWKLDFLQFHSIFVVWLHLRCVTDLLFLCLQALGDFDIISHCFQTNQGYTLPDIFFICASQLS